MRRGALGRGRNRGVGFTLVELLVATAIAAMLLALIASITSSATDASSRILDRLSAEEGAKVALEFMERDFDALASAEQGRTTLTLVQETLKGREAGAADVKSFWIMMTCRPMSDSDPGAIRMVSYRLVFADPMTGGANTQKMRLSLYRTRLTPIRAASTATLNALPLTEKTGSGLYFATAEKDTWMWNGKAFVEASKWWLPTETDLADGHDLHADFWQPNWATYAALDGGKAGGIGRTLLNDYLMEDIVDVDITLTYREADGALQSLTLPDEATINWTDQGFSGASIATPNATPNTPLSLTVALTSLRPEGARSYELEAMTLEKAITKYGVMQSKTFSLHSGL